MQVVVNVPKDLEREFSDVKPVFWQIVVGRSLNRELERLREIKSIVSRSKLTEKDVMELTDKVNESLSARYRKMYCGV